MAVASREQKQQIIQNLMKSAGKYSKPFEKGEMALTSFMGGSWNDYAQIVFNMMIADTLLEIEGQLDLMNQQLRAAGQRDS